MKSQGFEPQKFGNKRMAKTALASPSSLTWWNLLIPAMTSLPHALSGPKRQTAIRAITDSGGLPVSTPSRLRPYERRLPITAMCHLRARTFLLTCLQSVPSCGASRSIRCEAAKRRRRTKKHSSELEPTFKREGLLVVGESSHGPFNERDKGDKSGQMSRPVPGQIGTSPL